MRCPTIPVGLSLVAIAGFLLVSCASAPARLVRTPIPLPERRDLEQLLEEALVTPNEGDSATALGRFVETWRKERGTESAGEVSGIEVRFTTTGPGRYALAYFDEILATVDLDVKGMTRHRRAGIGAALVGIRKNESREPIERHFPRRRSRVRSRRFCMSRG